MQTLSRNTLPHIMQAIAICLLLASCDINTLSPEEKVLELLNNNNYSVLSDEDRKNITKRQFIELNMYGTKPRTNIGSKYHALEKIILGHNQYEIVSAKSDQVTQTTIVTVHLRYLAIKNTIYFLDNGPSDVEMADRLVKQLTEGTLNFTENDYQYSKQKEWTVRENGVFIDAKGILSFNKVLDERSAIIEQLPLITIASQTPTAELYKFNSLWQQYKEKLKQLDTQIVKKRPKMAEILEYDYRNVTDVEKTIENIELLKSELVFKNLKISKTDKGDLAVFGSYKTSKLLPFSLAFCRATFKNGETVIGSYTLTCANGLDKSTVRNFGIPIVNQELAKKSRTVTFEPIDYRVGVACKNFKHYDCG